MEWGYWFSVPYDVLAAAADLCLAGFGTGVDGHQIVRQTAGSVTFRMENEDHGTLGTLFIRKLSAERTELVFAEPWPWRGEAVRRLLRDQVIPYFFRALRYQPIFEGGAPAEPVPRPVPEDIRLRRERIRKCYLAGMEDRDIAEAEGVSVETVRRDRYKLGLRWREKKKTTT